MIKRWLLTVRGLHKRWGFIFEGDEQYLPDWLQDGFDVTEITQVIETGEAQQCRMYMEMPIEE